MRLVECVPNFSEGRRKDVIDEIKQAAELQEGAIVLDCHSSADHNRMVLTIIGRGEEVKDAALSASGKAVELIDMREHTGVHPRMGAVDVVPFVPLGEATMADCIELSNEFGKEFADRFSVPVFLYGESARREERKKLANVRAGQFEKLCDLIGSDSTREPDYGPKRIHHAAGATAVGARRILIAYNVDLATNDLVIAKEIAKNIRQIDGGLPGVQALGLRLENRGIVQVSTNLTDYKKTPIASVFEAVSAYARELNVQVVDSEIVGLVPKSALPITDLDHLKLINFSQDKILENRIEQFEKNQKMS
ncbi:MAG: glutamate formimidoyltransferase [Nitrososphaerales archaeon]